MSGSVGGPDYAGASTTTSTNTTEDDIDEMVADASVPNLASLLKQAMDKGLITPTKGYASA